MSKYYWFEILEMARRFSLTGLPALLRLVIGPGSKIEVGVGAITSASMAVYYSSIYISPYADRDDQLTMIPTQNAILLAIVSGTILSRFFHDSIHVSRFVQG